MISRITAEGSRRMREAIDRIASICARKRTATETFAEVAEVVEDLESGDGPLSKRGCDILPSAKEDR